MKILPSCGSLKMTSKWSENITLLFVQEYKNNPCLWNRQNDSYKNKRCREAAYKKIMERMNIPGFGVMEVKIKIKNLRSTYCQELKKIKDSRMAGFSAEDCYVPSVKWFKEMDSFLQMKRYHEETDNDPNPVEVILDEVDDEYYESPVSTNVNPTSTQDLEPTPKKWKSHLRDINTAVKELKDLRNAINKDCESEFDTFGKHVASQLKRLPLEQALLAQDRIQSFLTQCRLNDIRQTNAYLNFSNSPISSNSTEEATCDPLKLEML